MDMEIAETNTYNRMCTRQNFYALSRHRQDENEENRHDRYDR
jgi:hypothetical protein